MSAQIAGIPTDYRGVTFRSRLEAKWAAFFDLLDWQWTYEPYDLAGYIPDFVIPFDKHPFLFEVKPSIILSELEEPAGKIVRSGWTTDFAIVGGSIFDGDLYGTPHGPTLGVLGELRRGEPGYFCARAGLIWCLPCRGYSIYSGEGSWHCRRCGAANGQTHIKPLKFEDIHRIWAEASNIVQWKGRPVVS